MKRMLTYQLNELQKDGVNAIIFQVRAECDALYNSSLEPWSRFLTGKQGVAPSPYWDPLQWMITECHKRGMELHAWINPYRAKTKSTATLAGTHVAIKHPERVFAYANQFILNPGNPANREHIYKVVEDIVRRYDVDGIHMDDYFYPYPAVGETIPDDREFRLYNNGISTEKLAKELGCLGVTVATRLKKLGVKLRGKMLPKEIPSKLIAEYENGGSVASLCEKYNLCHITVLKELRRLGVYKDKTSIPCPDIAIDYYLQGYSAKESGKLAGGWSESAVLGLLRRRGISRRNRNNNGLV